MEEFQYNVRVSAVTYNRNRRYCPAQVKMIQSAVGVTADGQWGPNTISAVQRWQAAQQLPVDGKVGPQTLVAIFQAALAKNPDLWPIKTVGVWTGQTSFANPEDDVKYCVDQGINRLDVIVNDHSKWRTEQPFNTYDRDKIVRLCRAATNAGLQLNLMSWIMPYESYIEQAAQQLIPLCEEVSASSLMWDAEEPWNQAENAMPYGDAAKTVANAFTKLSCPMTATGIIYTARDKFGPLAAVCDALVPQCYATNNDGSPDPATVVSTGIDKWREQFTADAKFVAGLAAYKQRGISHYTVSSAMNASLINTRAYNVDTVVYWSLRQVKSSAEVAAVIKSIRANVALS